MSYDWRPSATRSATTDPSIVVPPRRGADISVVAAVEAFLTAAERGEAVNRSGRPFRPSALRDLRGILELHVVHDLGRRRLREVRREDVQQLVARLAAEGLSESRIRSVVSAVRGLFGWAIAQGHVDGNPADSLVMPELRAAGEPPPPRPRAPRPQPPATAAPEERPRVRDRRAYEPVAQLPDRILTYATRAVFVLLAVVTLLSLLDWR